MMMQPTHLRDFPDRAKLWPLDWPRHRTIHVQRPMCTPAMIIPEITSQKPPQMLLVEDEHVVRAIATDTPDEPFDIGILPGTPGRDQHLFDPHIMDALSKGSCTCCVRIIADQQNQVLYLPSITTEGRRHGIRFALRCAVDARLALARHARVVGMATRTICTAPGDAYARNAP